MSSDRRRPTREERDAARREAREAGAAARRTAKEAGDKARQKARQAAEEAREEAMEAAMAARREAVVARRGGAGGRGRGGAAGTGVPLVGEDPFGLLWEDAETASPSRGRGRGRGRGGSGLHRDEIVAAALKVAEAEGPEAVSMRRIAKDLGVGTMSLYHHIPTKDDLLDLMHDHVMGELLIPADELADNWRDALAQISRRTKAIYEHHHWMVSGAWERPQFGPRAFAHIEQSLAIMAGVPTEQMLQMLGVADDYVIGFVSRQVATRAALRRAGMDMQAYQKALRPYIEKLITERADEFPNLARFAGEDWEQDDDERFEQGLQWLLAGMAQALPSGA
jgi:AcrR family transcriptional regulator